jgi:hypothetical protein
MNMEKRGVISEGTPGNCGSGCGCSSQKTASDGSKQMELPFPEPVTEKQADSLSSSPMNDAIDAVVEETQDDA